MAFQVSEPCMCIAVNHELAYFKRSQLNAILSREKTKLLSIPTPTLCNPRPIVKSASKNPKVEYPSV